MSLDPKDYVWGPLSTATQQQMFAQFMSMTQMALMYGCALLPPPALVGVPPTPPSVCTAAAPGMPGAGALPPPHGAFPFWPPARPPLAAPMPGKRMRLRAFSRSSCMPLPQASQAAHAIPAKANSSRAGEPLRLLHPDNFLCLALCAVLPMPEKPCSPAPPATPVPATPRGSSCADLAAPTPMQVSTSNTVVAALRAGRAQLSIANPVAAM